MNKNVRPGGFFAKAEGALSWKERLAKMKAKSQRRSTAKLEVDDANGETMVFPDLGDVAEIAVDVAVTATDGTHVFTADATVYTVEVVGGKITKVDSAPVDEAAPEAMSEETVEFIEAVATGLEKAEAFETEATATIAELKTGLAEARKELKALKASMSHKKDGTVADTGDTGITIAGKKIDLGKINLK